MTETDDNATEVRVNPVTGLKNYFFYEHQPHLANLISGITSGLGAAIAIEWKAYFEPVRHVPVWETIFVAIFSATGALWVALLIIKKIETISIRNS